MSVIWQNNEWYGQGGGGGGDVTGRAKSTAIAPVFDATATYAAGDRVTYEDELYVFNTAHTGAWDAADVDKSDVDTLTERMPSTDMSEVASPMPGVMSRLPVLFDESEAEQVVGWYKYANGTKKPVYQKTIKINNPSIDWSSMAHGIANIEFVIAITSATQVVNGGTYLANYYHNSSDYSSTAVNSTSVLFSKSGGQPTSLSVTFRYIKTTDTPQ